MGATFLRKYGALLVAGTTSIDIPIIKRGVVDFALSGDWTPAAGDVVVNKDNAGAANITNLPTAIAMGNTYVWRFILTATELSGENIKVTVCDSATKAVEDQMFIIETYGNASAMYAQDFSASKFAATTGVGDDADAASIKSTIGVNGAGLTAIPAPSGMALDATVAKHTDITGLNNLSQAQAQAAVAAALAAYNTTGVATHADITGLNNISVSSIWSAALPGAYASGSAGYLIGSYINSSLSAIKSSADAAARPGNAMTLTSGQLTSIVNAIWEEPTSSHVNPGTMGAAINGVNVWSVSLPGSFASGTAGYILGNVLSAISGVSTSVGNIWTTGTRTLSNFDALFSTQFMSGTFSGDSETFEQFMQNLNLAQVRPRNAVVSGGLMWEYYYPAGTSPTSNGIGAVRKRMIETYDGSMPVISALDIAQIFPIVGV